MITEYHNDKEILDEINGFRNKFNDMWVSWLENDVMRYIKKNKKHAKENSIKMPTKTFKFKNQVYGVRFMYHYRLKKLMSSLSTVVETPKGKVVICFTYDKNDEISLLLPHYRQRRKQRDCKGVSITTENYTNEKTIKYNRNGKEYELIIDTLFNEISITRVGKEVPKLRYFITTLHMEDCTGKNYQELFKRADAYIDSCDIYEWK